MTPVKSSFWDLRTYKGQRLSPWPWWLNKHLNSLSDGYRQAFQVFETTWLSTVLISSFYLFINLTVLPSLEWPSAFAGIYMKLIDIKYSVFVTVILLKNKVHDTLVTSKSSTCCSNLSEKSMLAGLRAYTESPLYSGTGKLQWTEKVIQHTAGHRNIL